MISTLTILSLDQGNFYSPPPDRPDEATVEASSPATVTQAAEPLRASPKDKIMKQFQTGAAAFSSFKRRTAL